MVGRFGALRHDAMGSVETMPQRAYRRRQRRTKQNGENGGGTAMWLLLVVTIVAVMEKASKFSGRK
jgi:hypothetical protein